MLASDDRSVRLADAILDGRLKLLRGTVAIGAALGMSAFKVKQYLFRDEIEGAWQHNGRWYAISPRLKLSPHR